jgi:hypothetical protein
MSDDGYSQNNELWLDIDGVRCQAVRLTIPMKYLGKSYAAGDWIVEGSGVCKFYTHEHFAQVHGPAANLAGHHIYSIGFGTPDDPRNVVPTSPDDKQRGDNAKS